MNTITSEVAFGIALRHWRTHRRMSQAALSEAAEVSTRHISFLETGRARPSQQMVLILASALELPLRHRNGLLASAGFAPAYSHRDLGAPELDQVRQAVEFVLRQSDPNPAMAVDRRWRLHAGNMGAARLGATFLTPEVAWLPNAMHMLFHPDGFRKWLVNWPQVASLTLAQLRVQAVHDPQVLALLEELDAFPPVREVETSSTILIPFHLRKGALELRFTNLLTTLGSAVDVTARELTVETWFPLDDATRQWVQAGATA